MEMRKPSYGSQSHEGSPASKSNLKKITGLFATEQGKGYEVRVSEDILAALAGVSVGDYLKVYENQTKDGSKTYLSLNVKPVKAKAQA